VIFTYDAMVIDCMSLDRLESKGIEFLKKVDEKSKQKIYPIGPYEVGYELNLDPNETAVIVKYLEDMGAIIALDTAPYQGPPMTLELTEKGKKKIQVM
jgi:hypothetical protein